MKWRLALLVLALVSAESWAAGRIAIEDFEVAPMRLALGEDFGVRARVSAEGVPRVSSVIRTVEPMPREAAPPVLDYYRAERQLAFLSEGGDVHLADNGEHDLAKEDLVFATRLSTEGWKEGRYVMAFFAHNRPAPGPHIVDERRFVVVVKGESVEIKYAAPPRVPEFEACGFREELVNPGEKAILCVTAEAEEGLGLEVRQQYYLAPEFVPEGFSYDTERHASRLCEEGGAPLADNEKWDKAPELGRFEAPIDTGGLPSGLYHFAVVLHSLEGKKSRECDVAFKVASADDQFEVHVSPSWRLFEGTHAERVTPLADGTLVYTSHWSDNKGATWTRRDSGTIGPGAEKLRDGRVLGMSYKTLPIEGKEGWYRGERFLSEDNGRTVKGPLEALFHVPEAKAAHGHAHHKGPLFMRSIVERPDGSLVALMAGWFKSDEALCPYGGGRPYSRTYVCESADGGETWTYLNTIGYAHIGSEGYNEGSLKALPNGDLLAVMRTGSMKDPRHQDNPIMASVSHDGGRTWAEPWRTGVNGAFPDLCVLSDGTLAVSYGRPGASLMFSTDLGKTWTDRTILDANRYSGYTTLCETAPGEILVIFGVKDWYDGRKDEVRDDVRAVRVHYGRKGDKEAAGNVRERFARHGLSVEPLGDGFYEGEVVSGALGRPERFSVHIPAGGVEGARGLIVFLHGAGRNHLTLLDHPKTRGVLEASPCVVLMPNGRMGWWVDSPVDAASQYASYVEELIGLVTASLGLPDAPERRALGGWSMGGFGSLSYLLDHGGGFCAWAGILALADFPNPGYPPGQNHEIPGVFGDESHWEGLNPLGRIEKARGKGLYFTSGREAFDFGMNETLAKRLEGLGIAHTFVPVAGGHTFDVVESTFPEAMGFLAAAVGAH